MMADNEYLVDLSIDNHIAVITLNDPPANVLSTCMIFSLEAAIEKIKLTDDVGVVILTGNEIHSFCAGADIVELNTNTPEDNQKFFHKVYRFLNNVESIPCPVIAAMNGYAMGAGLELSLCADIRVMDQSAHLAASGANMGLVFCTQRLPRLIGPGKAKDLLFSGRRVDAREAFDMGIVEYIASEGKSLEKAQQLANIIVQKSSCAVLGAKQAVSRGLQLPLQEGLKVEEECLSKALKNKDFQHRAAQFVNKPASLLR